MNYPLISCFKIWKKFLESSGSVYTAFRVDISKVGLTKRGMEDFD